MSRKKLFRIVLLIVFPLIALEACNHAKDGEENISKHGDDDSHNMGQNCMNCHKKGGEGEGWFYIAGTAYSNSGTNYAQDVTLLMYTEPDGAGTVKYTVEGDSKGNFYTTNIIGFGNGLYPAVVYNNDTSFMSSSISHGACNSCHGVSTDKITVD
jgi:cytochrome c553